MERENFINFIQSILPMPGEIASQIAMQFEEREIPENDYFLKIGSMSKEYMFLEEGFMRSYTFDTEGNEITTGLYSKNRIIFEVSSFFSAAKSKENIQALTDSRGYVISFNQLNFLFHSIPEFRDFGRAILVNGFVALKQRTLSLINETAEERYEKLINSDPEIFQFAKLKYIATYLGITDTSLSRIRREFQKK